MHQYKNLIRTIMREGHHQDDRTGTGTTAIFGHQMRFDLSEGFPLVTLKRTFFKGVAHELLWFLRGETNVRSLQQVGVHIWDEWADEDGDLGPIYGSQWAAWGRKPATMKQRPPTLPPGVHATYLGIANGAGKEGHPLKKVWEGMLARCYDTNSISYPHYGARGVSVCDRWLEFSNFASDAESLPGYDRRLAGERMELDKDYRGSGFLYSLETCKWVTPRDNQHFTTRKITVEGPDGVLHTFSNPSEFCREQGIPDGNFSDLWTGRKNAKVRHGYRLVSVEDKAEGTNQLAAVLAALKEDPHGRRHIVSAWNPDYLPFAGVPPHEQPIRGRMALAPCHVLFQFHISADMKLSCQVYQRSADSFLGVPFNIASYALLTHLFAHHLGLQVGDLVWTGGDCHIYDNHRSQVEEMMKREPLPLPQITFHHSQEKMPWQAKYDDIELLDYQCHPAIKAPVAV